MLSADLKKSINQLWDKFWAGGMSNPIVAIEQISYLLFMRRIDNHDAYFKGTVVLPNITMPIEKETLRWRNFPSVPHVGKDKLSDEERAEKEMAQNALYMQVRERVFPFIKQLNGETKAFTKQMENAYFEINKPALLADAIGAVDAIYEKINQQNQDFQDTAGDLYEYLLNEISRSGKNGQFRTPRHLIQLMCELVQPDLDGVTVDFACGTAGFLVGAYQHILTKYSSEQHKRKNDDGFEVGLGDLLTDAQRSTLQKGKLFEGFDFDSTMTRIGAMNMLMHGIEDPQIERVDTLSKKFKSKQYRYILANPPFKGSVDKDDIASDLSDIVNTSKSELLFVARIIQQLAVSGRAGVVVPDGVLFGSSAAHIALRKRLLHQCCLEAVVSLPSGVFKPYAGVSTAVLIFTKRYENDQFSENNTPTEKVWFYDVKRDGYTLDDKRTPKKEETDLPDVVERYKKRGVEPNEETTKCFWVSLGDIIAENYSLIINQYQKVPIVTNSPEHPDVILNRINSLNAEIKKTMLLIEALIK